MFKFHDLDKKVKGDGSQDPWVAVLTATTHGLATLGLRLLICKMGTEPSV